MIGGASFNGRKNRYKEWRENLEKKKSLQQFGNVEESKANSFAKERTLGLEQRKEKAEKVIDEEK